MVAVAMVAVAMVRLALHASGYRKYVRTCTLVLASLLCGFRRHRIYSPRLGTRMGIVRLPFLFAIRQRLIFVTMLSYFVFFLGMQRLTAFFTHF